MVQNVTDMATGIVNVPAGQRRCIDLSTKASNNASVEGFVTSGHKVKFVFLGKPDGASQFIEVGNSGPDPVSSYAQTITAQTHPSFFPGVFRACVRNPSQKPSTVSLTITVDK
jgi:hypothetical protein